MKIELAPIQDETNEDHARVAVADFVEKRYGVSFDTTVKDYEGVTSRLGLSGPATSHYATLKAGSAELDERAGKVAKRYNQGPIEKRARSLAGSILRFAYAGTAGTVKLSEQQGVMPLAMGMPGGSAYDFSPFVSRLHAEREQVSERLGESPEYLESFEGKLQAGGVSLAGMIAAPFSIIPTLVDEAITDAEVFQGVPYDRMEPEKRERVDKTALLYGVIGYALEKLPIDKTILRGLISGGERKATKEVLNVLAAGGAEVVAERAQSKTLDGLAAAIQEDGRDVWESDDLLGKVAEFFGHEESLIAAILGGGARATVSTSEAIYSKFLDPERAATAADFAALEKNATDEEVMTSVITESGDIQLAELAVQAKHGDKAAQAAYVEQSTIDPASDPVAAAGLTEEEFAALGGSDTSALPPEYYEAAPRTGDEVRTAFLDEAQEYFESIQLPDQKIDRDDNRLVSFQDRLFRMQEAEGWTDAQRDAYAYDVLQKASANEGVDLTQVDPARLATFGESVVEYTRDVATYKSKLNKGATGFTLVEEEVEGWFKRYLNTGEASLEDFIQWKRSVEAERGGKPEYDDSRRGVEEWTSRQGVAWFAANRRNLEKSGAMPQSFREFLQMFFEKVRSIFKDAAFLRKLKRDGKLDPKFMQFLDRATGQDEAFLIEQFERGETAESFFDPTDELLPSVRRLGGIPTPSADPAFKGELENLRESFGTRWASVSKSNGSLDNLAEGLREVGFAFETPADLLDALDAASRGEKVFPMLDSRSAAAQREASFSIGPVNSDGSDVPRKGGAKAIQAWAKKHLPNEVETPTLGKVEGIHKGVKGSMAHGFGRDKAEAVAAIPDLLKAGILIESEAYPENPNLTGHFLAQELKMGDRDFTAVLLVREDSNGKRFYLHEAFLKEGTPAYSRTGRKTDTASTGVMYKVAQKFEKVKKDSGATFSIGMMDDADSDAMQSARERTPEEIKLAQALREFRESDRKTPVMRARLKELQIKAVESRKRQRLETSAMKKLEEEYAKRIEAIRRLAEERKDLEQAIKSLESLLVGLPPVVKGRFSGFGALASRKTDAGKRRYIAQATARIENIFAKYNRTENRKRLVNIIAPYYTNYGPNLRKLAQRVGEEARNELRFAAQLSRNSDVPTPKGMNEFRAEHLRNIFSGVVMPGASAERIADALKLAGEIAKGGRQKMDAFNEARIERNQERNTEAVDTILKGEEQLDGQTLADRRVNRTPAEKAVDMFAGFLFHPLNGLQQHMNILDGVKGGYLDRTFNAAAIEAQQTESSLQRDHAEQTESGVLEIFANDAKKAALWLKGATTPVPTSIAWDTGKGMEKRTLSKMQGVDILLKAGDTTLQDTFEAMGIISATVDQVKDFVGPEGVRLAEYLRSRYADIGTDIQTAFKATEGFAMDLVDGYGGRVHRDGVKVEADDTMFAFGGKNARASVKSASMKERTDNTLPIMFKDAAHEFSRHMREANHYISHAQLAKDLFATFRNNDVRAAIKQRKGDDFLASLDSLVDDIISGRIKRTSQFDGALNKVRANFTKASLAIKPAIMIKQLTSAPAFIEEIGFTAYSKAFAKFSRNPIQHMRTVLETDYIRNRLDGSMYADLQQELDARDNVLRRIYISDLIMLNVKAGDIGAILLGGTPVYIHAYDAAKASGRSDVQARAEAEAALAESSERAQQSSAMHARGSYIRGNELMRTFFMYLTSPLQYQRNINVALVNLVSNVRDGRAGLKSDVGLSAKQAARAVLVYHVMLPQIFQAVASGLTGFFSDDDEIFEQFWRRQLRALLLGNVNTFPVLGNLFDGLANMASGADETFFGSTGSPLIDFAAEVTRDIMGVVKDPDSGESWFKVLEDAAKLGGVPLETVVDNFDALKDAVDGNTDFPLLRLLGWSEWALGE